MPPFPYVPPSHQKCLWTPPFLHTRYIPNFITINPQYLVKSAADRWNVTCLYFADERNWIYIWRVAENMVTKFFRTTDKGWSYSLLVERKANNSSPQQKEHVMQQCRQFRPWPRTHKLFTLGRIQINRVFSHLRNYVLLHVLRLNYENIFYVHNAGFVMTFRNLVFCGEKLLTL